MVTTPLYSVGGADDHVHVNEDLTSQIDGYKLSFTTSQPFIPKTLIVIYSGVTYTKDNDFEVTGPQEFTFFPDPRPQRLFPPKPDRPLFVTYQRVLPP
jgi:hypothetical protein